MCFSAMFLKRLEALKWLKYPLSLEQNKAQNRAEWDGEKAAASSPAWRAGLGQLIPCSLLTLSWFGIVFAVPVHTGANGMWEELGWPLSPGVGWRSPTSIPQSTRCL